MAEESRAAKLFCYFFIVGLVILLVLVVGIVVVVNVMHCNVIGLHLHQCRAVMRCPE